MANITANTDAWSSTEGSNQPQGATTIGTTLDDDLRAIQAGVVLYTERVNAPHNLALACSVASNALTIAVKGKDGADPSSTNKVIVPFRNATVATGDFTKLTISSATSLVVSSDSTLGTVANIPFRFWIVGFNDGGTFRLGVINCATTAAGAGAGRDVTAIYPLKGWGIASSTAEGGAGAADSAQTFYTGTAVTSKAYTVLGYITYESGLGTAGTYASAPTRVQLFANDPTLPGDVIQVQRTPSGAVATGTTTLPYDDTIPQNTEGDQYMTQAITPTSAANALAIGHVGTYATSNTDSGVNVALFQDATANALVAARFPRDASADSATSGTLRHAILASTTSATTFKVRAGTTSAGTTTFNGSSGARRLGGVMASTLGVQELMA